MPDPAVRVPCAACASVTLTVPVDAPLDVDVCWKSAVYVPVVGSGPKLATPDPEQTTVQRPL